MFLPTDCCCVSHRSCILSAGFEHSADRCRNQWCHRICSGYWRCVAVFWFGVWPRTAHDSDCWPISVWCRHQRCTVLWCDWFLPVQFHAEHSRYDADLSIHSRCRLSRRDATHAHIPVSRYCTMRHTDLGARLHSHQWPWIHRDCSVCPVDPLRCHRADQWKSCLQNHPRRAVAYPPHSLDCRSGRSRSSPPHGKHEVIFLAIKIKKVLTGIVVVGQGYHLPAPILCEVLSAPLYHRVQFTKRLGSVLGIVKTISRTLINTIEV